MADSSDKKWYALRVFKNRLRYVKSQVEEAGNETYQALKTIDTFNGGSIKYKVVPLIPALLFIKVTPAYIEKLKKDRYDHVLVYGTPEGKPEPISDEQMDAGAGDCRLLQRRDRRSKKNQERQKASCCHRRRCRCCRIQHPAGIFGKNLVVILNTFLSF